MGNEAAYGGVTARLTMLPTVDNGYYFVCLALHMSHVYYRKLVSMCSSKQRNKWGLDQQDSVAYFIRAGILMNNYSYQIRKKSSHSV
jgi:hypothetical protein